MWTTTYHRFLNRAAFLDACAAADWPVTHSAPELPHGVALDMVGALIGPPSIGDGDAPVAGEIVDPRFHVNLAWHARNMDPAFAASQIAPATPSRIWGLRPVPAPAARPVPVSIPAWKGKAALREAGLLEIVESAVKSAGGRAHDAWEGASEWQRDSAFLAELATIIGLAPDKIDQMFQQADAIKG